MGGRVVLQGFKGADNFEPEFTRQGVHRLWAVQGQGRDPVGFLKHEDWF